MWSEESFAGRASRAVRKVLQKASSAIVGDVVSIVAVIRKEDYVSVEEVLKVD